MELHNPAKLGLPPLLIEKQSSRAEMERSPDIVAFIESNLLLDKQFHSLFILMANRSADIEAIIAQREQAQIEYQWVPAAEREKYAKLAHHYSIRLPQGQLYFNTSIKGQIRNKLLDQLLEFLPKSGTRNMAFEHENNRFQVNALLSEVFSQRNQKALNDISAITTHYRTLL